MNLIKNSIFFVAPILTILGILGMLEVPNVVLRVNPIITFAVGVACSAISMIISDEEGSKK